MSDKTDRFESREELAAKIEWEGGLEAAFDYGIRSDYMPEGDEELTALWREAEDAFARFDDALYPLRELLEEFE